MARPADRAVRMRGWLVATVAAAALIGTVGPASPVGAQQADTPTAAVERQMPFNIPSQDLNAALLSFAGAAGVQTFYDVARVQGLRSTAVTGTMTPEEALRRLLSGTGMTFRFTSPTMVALERVSQGGAPGTIVLDPVTVEGQAGPPRQAEIGNLPPAYAGGQVARGGKVGILGNKDMMDTPFSQTSYTQQTIENQQARDISDVLMNDPSVQPEAPSGSAAESHFVRGFGAATTFNGLHGITSDSENSAVVFERVEILKGPNALLNGFGPSSSAGPTVGGTINLVPKRATDDPITQLTGSYYSDSQFSGHLDVGRRFGEGNRFGIRFNGLYRDGDTAVDLQSEEAQVAALALDYRGERLRLSADLGYQAQRIDGTRGLLSFSTGTVLDAPKSHTNYAQSWAFKDSEHKYAVARGEFDLFDNLTAYLTGGLRQDESFGIFINPSVTDDQGTLSQGGGYFTRFSETATIETGLRGEITTGFVDHAVSLSYTNFWSEGRSDFASPVSATSTSNLYNPTYFSKPDFNPSIFTGTPIGDPEDSPKASESEFSSITIADTLSVLDERIQLILGVRHQGVNQEGFDQTTGNKTSSYDEAVWSPAVGLVVKPWGNVSLYANYIEGLQQGQTAPITAANSGEIFPPYVTEQYEVGAKLDLGDWATTLALFEISQPNASIDPSTNIFGVNGEVRNRGVELSTFGEPLDGVRILAGVTFLDAKLAKTAGGI